jgi:hypothetical protein
MPLARYFFFVGGVLLALLFIADACLPNLPVADRASTDFPVIRIHSNRKWPERVVYDTSLPTIIPAQIANTNASIPPPEVVADISANAQVREAFAQLQPSKAELRQYKLKTLEPKLQRKRKIAKRRVAPSMDLVARQPQFGFFGNSIW